MCLGTASSHSTVRSASFEPLAREHFISRMNVTRDICIALMDSPFTPRGCSSVSSPLYPLLYCTGCTLNVDLKDCSGIARNSAFRELPVQIYTRAVVQRSCRSDLNIGSSSAAGLLAGVPA